jgi:hypothetical protein
VEYVYRRTELSEDEVEDALGYVMMLMEHFSEYKN